jgi:hypothetical protein
MHTGETIHPTSQPRCDGRSEGPITPSRIRTWDTLSIPERRGLAATLKRCNQTDGPEASLLIANIGNDEVRAAAISLLCRKDYLIRNPATRGRLLEALLPFADECRVQAYAMLSLKDPLYARSYSVCAPAARIIESTKRDRDPAITYELIDLAARLSPQGRDAAARISFILLSDSTLTSGQYQLALFNARVWYIEHKGSHNPWLEIVTQQKKRPTVLLLKDIINGNISDPREYPVLKNVITLPLLPHEIAITASVVTIAARKLGNLLGVQNNLAAPSAALAATVMIVGGRCIWKARRIDVINSHRTFEKLEAIKHLGALLDSTTTPPLATERKVKKDAVRVLKSTDNFLFAPEVRSAALQTLNGH